MNRNVVGAAIAVAFVVAGWFVYQRYFGSHTRPTEVPPLIPHVARPGDPHMPRPAHVVIVMEENKSNSTIIGDSDAPYINHLAAIGASFTHATGVAHPSQPNYLALFSGQTNADADACPETGVAQNTPSLGGALIKANRSFAGYSEALPHAGYTGCFGGVRHAQYARKHAPWVNFQDVPPNANLPLDSLPPFDRLPTVSFIIPDLQDDMHSGSIETADAWLQRHVDPIVTWAAEHDSLIVVAWDESDTLYANSIPLIIVGASVKPGVYTEGVDHYRLLRTIEDFYGLPYLGHSANVAPIDDIWQRR